jgi:hypothetical protein
MEGECLAAASGVASCKKQFCCSKNVEWTISGPFGINVGIHDGDDSFRSWTGSVLTAAERISMFVPNDPPVPFNEAVYDTERKVKISS